MTGVTPRLHPLSAYFGKVHTWLAESEESARKVRK